VIVHEIAHQWAGDSVGINRWRHIWLAEGFATYAEWLWSESHDRGTARQLFKATYELYPRDDFFWELPVTRPSDSFYLLGTHVYERGAMTLLALRNILGNRAFFRILRAWTRENADGVVDTADFRHSAERISGKDLGHLFHVWLETDHRPHPRWPTAFPRTSPARSLALAPSHPARSQPSTGLWCHAPSEIRLYPVVPPPGVRWAPPQTGAEASLTGRKRSKLATKTHVARHHIRAPGGIRNPNLLIRRRTVAPRGQGAQA
jgi:Peptidase family M1 domain